MAISVKQISLWRVEVDNQPGMLARTLEPLAAAGADLRVVMGYRFPGNNTRAAIELYPVSGKKAVAAAQQAGLAQAAMPALLLEGDNKAGLGHAISKAIGEAGINLDFLVAQVVGHRFSAVAGFESEADAKKAATLIKKAAAPAKKAAARGKK
jgi:hypothetical protein